MFETINNETLVYKFVNKETGKDVKINYFRTITDKKTIDAVIESIKDLVEKDAYTVREQLLARKLINTNKGMVLDAFAALDAKFGFSCPESEDDDNPL